VQSAGGAVYLRASEPMEPTRIQLQDADTGALILLDISARVATADEPALEPIRIVEGEATRDDVIAPPPRQTPIAVVLTRFAAQNLYATLRTIEPVPSIQRVTLRRDINLDTLLPTLPVQAVPLAAWRFDCDVPASNPWRTRHAGRHHRRLSGHPWPRIGAILVTRHPAL